MLFVEYLYIQPVFTFLATTNQGIGAESISWVAALIGQVLLSSMIW
jgi:hypothetical protein